MVKKYSNFNIVNPDKPGYRYIISKIIVTGFSVFVVCEVRQETAKSLRLTDIGVILKGSSFGLTYVKYSSALLYLFSITFLSN